MKRGDHPKADLRRDITAWRLLVWAYRDECVRAASSEVVRQAGSNGLALLRMGETGIGGGTINGLLESHLDALRVDAFVGDWMTPLKGGRDWIAAAAERGRPPVLPERLPRLRAGPEINGKGKVVEFYPLSGRREAYLCPVVWEGWSDAEIEAYRQRHVLFLALLPALAGLALEKWRVTERGLTAGGESLTSDRILSAVRPGA